MGTICCRCRCRRHRCCCCRDKANNSVKSIQTRSGKQRHAGRVLHLCTVNTPQDNQRYHCVQVCSNKSACWVGLRSSLESFLKNKERKARHKQAQQARKHIPAVFTLFSFHLNHLGSFINKLRLSCPTRFSVKKPPTSHRRTETLRQRLWGNKLLSDRVPAGDHQVPLWVWGDRKETNTALVSEGEW